MSNSIQTIDQEKQAVRERLRALKKYNTYDVLETMTLVNRKELCNLVKYDDYDPGPKIWHRLGVDCYDLAPVCARCGVVHTTKRCTRRADRPRPKRPAVNIRSAQSTYNTLVKAGVTDKYLSELANIILTNGLGIEY